jgi:hypothetical protein
MFVSMFLLFFSINESIQVADEIFDKNDTGFWSCLKEKGFHSECISQFKLCLLVSSFTDIEVKYYSS